MDSEECLHGTHVQINDPDNPLLHNSTGVVVDRPASDEAVIRLDEMKPEFAHYSDLKRGLVTLDPEKLKPFDGTKPVSRMGPR